MLEPVSFSTLVSEFSQEVNMPWSCIESEFLYPISTNASHPVVAVYVVAFLTPAACSTQLILGNNVIKLGPSPRAAAATAAQHACAK